MPTYEYQCQKCGHQFEYFQTMAAEPLKYCIKDQCPHHEGRRGRVKRLISGGGGLLFKGSGFYTTDYRSESYKKAEKAAVKEDKSSSDGAKKDSSPTSKKD